VLSRISVEGDARERGRQYGEAARRQVRRSIEAYFDVFEVYAGWDPQRVREEAERYRSPIAGHGPKYVDELIGIAEGAAVPESDVFAINVRTEVMFAATARAAEAGRDVRQLPPECSAFAVLGRRAGGELLVGQNWDWLAHASDTTVVLEVRQDDGPDFVTVVEAGLLAKAGFNSAGVAVVTNALVCDQDRGEPAVPYHVLLRSIMDAEAISEAFATLQAGPRASSANYLLAHADDVAFEVEAAPGDRAGIYVGCPDDDLLLHTNHFRYAALQVRDLSTVSMPSSPLRLARLEQLVGAHDGALDRGFWETALADHAMLPFGVCCHPDPRAATEVDRYATLLSLIMEPGTRRLWLASGNPCETAFELLDYGDFLA
jgi:isopenicillin-N N-acyltransferase-like protein